MHLHSGTVVELDIEKPVAGGRMLARHEGLVVLVLGAIPGERVAARIERTAKGAVYASTEAVLRPSPDRRPVSGDARCGGQAYSHIEYARQLRLKGEILQDAFARIGRQPLAEAPDVAGSPERGYRMRARLHAVSGRLGFFREGTHQLCDAAATGQLLPAAGDWIAEAEATLRRADLRGLAGLELTENVGGDQRACHLELHGHTDPGPFAALSHGLTGLSAANAVRPRGAILGRPPVVTDVIRPAAGADVPELTIRRDARAFFQGNRFLLETLVRRVVEHVAGQPVVDLYAGVGLFGLAAAAARSGSATLVEADPAQADCLRENAASFGDRVRVEHAGVEAFLASPEVLRGRVAIVDPPRTGLSRQALAGLLRGRPPRIVYVSCDVATLARDARALREEGYELRDLSALDLFPNTAHLECIAVLENGASRHP